MSRAADIEVRARGRALTRDLAQRKKQLQAFGRSAGKGLGTGFRASLGSLAAFGTAGGLAAVGKSVFDFEKSLTRLGIQAGSGLNLDSFRAQVTAVSGETGLSRERVLSAATALVNLQGAAGASAEKMAVLAKASVATGADMSELAGIAFSLDNAFGISNADELEKALSAVIEAGKQGSVPLGEMSTVLQQLGTTFRRVSGSGKDAAADFAAVIQVARRGFGSAAETGTGLKAFVSQLDQAGPKLRAFGVRTTRTAKDGTKELRPLREIVDQIAKSRLAKDPEMLARVFGSVEARQFLATMIKNRRALDDIATAAKRSNAVQDDSAKFLQSNAGRMQTALQRVRGEFEDLFTPERIEKFARAAELLADGIAFAVDHLEELVHVFVAFKALQGAVLLGRMAKNMSALAQNAGSASSAIGGTNGKLGKMGGMAASIGAVAGALGAAFVAGWELGRALDNALGLSDKLADGLSSVFGLGSISFAEAAKEFEAVEELQKRGITDIDPFTARTQLATVLRAEEADRTSGLTPEQLAERDEKSRALSAAAGRRRAASREREKALAGLTLEQRVGRLSETQRADFGPQLEQLTALAESIRAAAERPIVVQSVLDGRLVGESVANNPHNRRSPAR